MKPSTERTLSILFMYNHIFFSFFFLFLLLLRFFVFVFVFFCFLFIASSFRLFSLRFLAVFPRLSPGSDVPIFGCFFLSPGRVSFFCLQDIPKDLLREGFEERPKEPKKKTAAGADGSSYGGGGGNGGGHGDGGRSAAGGGQDDAGEWEKPRVIKPKPEPLLGAKALQYGIVFSTVK